MDDAPSSGRVSLLRKLIHVATTIVPLLGWMVSYWLALALSGAALVASLVLEGARHWWPWVNRLLWRWFPSIFREWEDRRALGCTWFGIGMLVTLLLFGQNAGGTAILYLAWGDPAAEVLGRRWGKPGQRKTLAGSLGCLVACLLAGVLGVYLGGLSPWAVLAGAVVATLVERWSPPPDDNVWIPILSGLAMLLVQGFIEGSIELFPDLLRWAGS
jgi:dolichol kinase